MNVDDDGWLIRPATTSDQAAIATLLRAASLPTEGVGDAGEYVVVAAAAGAVVASAGIELYDDAALLRSVVVAPAARARGLGGRLVADRLARAAAAGARDAYLLTTTADAFFAALGFVAVDRDQVAAGVRGSAEFSTLCPDTATVMHRSLIAGTEPASPEDAVLGGSDDDRQSR